MIAANIENSEFFIDVGRPDLVNESDFAFWKEFHDLVEASSIPIRVNGAYGFIKQNIDAKQGYLGGGLKYMFWFKDADDKQAFLKEMRESPSGFRI